LEEMISFKDDRFFNTKYETTEKSAVSYEKTGVINYNSLYIDKDGEELPLFYNNETKRYLNIKYEHF